MDKGIDKYLEDIGKAQLLSHEEELELIKAVQKKGTDCDEMKQLEESSARFFVSLSCQYKVQGIDTMQLVEAGKEGLRRAALKYDFNTDAKFLPFAVWFMRQEMQKVLPGEEYPEAHIYELSGDSSTLNAVSTLIDELCQRFGTPDNECGLYIPQQALMKTLIGSSSIYYRGNIIKKKFTPEGRLVIETESDKGEPLLYALRQAFSNLNVKMKE